MRIYGLTGGTGSGKSEVARRFVELGISVIDADKVGHDILEPGGAAVEAVAAAFGPAVRSGDGIDREKLAATVFGNADALKRLNALVHPVIYRVIGERCRALAEAGHTAVVIDAALLGEGGRRDPWLDGLIFVLAPKDTRLARLIDSRGMDPTQARRRIEAQTPPEQKVPFADWVIENTGTLEALRLKADAVAASIRTAGSAQCPAI